MEKIEEEIWKRKTGKKGRDDKRISETKKTSTQTNRK
jgi:hypothetical protein